MSNMKVKCISNTNASSYLTVGKIYDVIEVGNSLIRVLDDLGVDEWYYATRFASVEDNIGFQLGNYITSIDIRINLTRQKLKDTINGAIEQLQHEYDLLQKDCVPKYGICMSHLNFNDIDQLSIALNELVAIKKSLKSLINPTPKED
jgi:hypothetical protein